jgi:hypothetical protein
LAGTAFFAGAAFFAAAFLAVAVVVLRVEVAATARVLATSMFTEMPCSLRWPSSALRCRGSMAASSLARRTSSGVTLPEGAPRSTRVTMAGCVSTSAGILRAFEVTNTSRELA